MKNIVTVKQESWNAGATKWLAPACDDLYPVSELRECVLAGRSSLFNIYDDVDDHVASFVLRIDGGNVREMVVVAAGGNLPGFSLCKLMIPFIESVAASRNCDFMRFHTKSEGLGRVMTRGAGFSRSEIVYRKAVGHGRQILQ